MTDQNPLDKQIAAEAAAIENAPAVPVSTMSGMHGRCSFCGRVSLDLQYVETVHGIARYKGECCHG
jgi:hypothetical protein